MALITIDENRWPIVIITLTGNEDKNDVREFLGKLENYQNRDEEFCFVLDLREINNLSLEVREMLLSWLKNAEFHALAGTAIVISSPLTRLYLTAVMWVTKLMDRERSRSMHITFDSMNEAYQWSRNRLQFCNPGNSRKTASFFE